MTAYFPLLIKHSLLVFVVVVVVVFLASVLDKQLII